MAGKPPVKYFCEFCGSLVRSGDKICPHCGSFFSQVRCPACQFQGESHLFRDGCPVCGFAGGAAVESAGKASARAKKGAKGQAARKPGLEVAYLIDEPKPRAQPGMPAWALALLALACVAAAITAAVLAKS